MVTEVSSGAHRGAIISFEELLHFRLFIPFKHVS